MRQLASLVTLAVLAAVASGCVEARPRRELQKEAENKCWTLRSSMKDWRLAATQCAQQIQKMDGVQAAWVDGYTVRVKFSDYEDQIGIWMK